MYVKKPSLVEELLMFFKFSKEIMFKTEIIVFITSPILIAMII